MFKAGPFGQFIGMHIPNGDPLLIHLMMLHEVRSQKMINLDKFEFEVQGYRIVFSEQDFCLISGMRFGPFVDLLGKLENKYNSKFRARLFPESTDDSLRPGDIEKLILSERYLSLADVDRVKLVELNLLLKGLIGRDLKTCIPEIVYKLLDDPYEWQRY